MARYNPFDAPIPGQSLTDTPGNYAWEHPPKINKVEDAMNYLMNRFTQEDNAENLASMLKAGIPVEAIARVVLFAGFTEGKWSVDLAVLIGQPLMQLIAAIGSRLGIKEMYITMQRKKKTNVGNEMIVRKEVSKAMESLEKELADKEEGDEEKEPMPMGLMSREENEEEME